MNINDTGLLVQYIYAKLLNESTTFKNDYYLNHRYTEKCHNLFCDYYKSLVVTTKDQLLSDTYYDILSMMNLSVGSYYDEQNDFHVFSSKDDSTRYRCFIIPVNESTDKAFESFYTSATSVKYRYTSRPSIYRIAIDPNIPLVSNNVWSDIHESTNNKIDWIDSDKDEWKYLVIGIELTDTTPANILVNHLRDESLLSQITDAYNEQSWAINDEAIPYILGYCITPLSSTDDILYVQRSLLNLVSYFSDNPGMWDDQITSTLKYIQDNKLVELFNEGKLQNKPIFNYGYFTPATEYYIAKQLSDVGEEMNYYEFF